LKRQDAIDLNCLEWELSEAEEKLINHLKIFRSSVEELLRTGDDGFVA